MRFEQVPNSDPQLSQRQYYQYMQYWSVISVPVPDSGNHWFPARRDFSPVSALSAISAVFFAAGVTVLVKKPPRRARGKAPARIFHHNDTKTQRGVGFRSQELGVRSYPQWFQARRESMIKLTGSAEIPMSSRFQVLASRFQADVPGHVPFSTRCSVTPSPHLCLLLVNKKRFSPQRHKDTKTGGGLGVRSQELGVILSGSRLAGTR